VNTGLISQRKTRNWRKTAPFRSKQSSGHLHRTRLASVSAVLRPPSQTGRVLGPLLARKRASTVMAMILFRLVGGIAAHAYHFAHRPPLRTMKVLAVWPNEWPNKWPNEWRWRTQFSAAYEPPPLPRNVEPCLAHTKNSPAVFGIEQFAGIKV
jgi:hypothetical protein